MRIVHIMDRTKLVDATVHTVLKNMSEGILLVAFIVFLFLFTWRTTVIVASVIPLSFLFAIIMLRIQGLPANLISLGALDFGLLLEGTLVIVEVVYVALLAKSEQLGPRYSSLARGGIIKKSAGAVASHIFFAQIILIVALIPIFSFQKVEGKMFSPLAFTLGFAVLGALLFTFTLVPVLSSMLLKRNVREKNNWFVRVIYNGSSALFDRFHAHSKWVMGIACGVAIVGLSLFHCLGSEFLPQLTEGSIYIRSTLPQSIALDESVGLAHARRRKLMAYHAIGR